MSAIPHRIDVAPPACRKSILGDFRPTRWFRWKLDDMASRVEHHQARAAQPGTEENGRSMVRTRPAPPPPRSSCFCSFRDVATDGATPVPGTRATTAMRRRQPPCHPTRTRRSCVSRSRERIRVEASPALHTSPTWRSFRRTIAMLTLLRCDGYSVSTLLPKPGTDRGSGDRLVEEAGPAPVAARRRIGNGFLPPPLFLHEPGRFEGTQVDSSRLDGCQQTLDVERIRPQPTRRQSVTETRSHGFDSRRFQGSVRLSAGHRAGPHSRGRTGTSCAAVRLSCACVRSPRLRVAGRRAIVVR